MTLPINQIIQGDCLEILKTLPPESVNCVITSPPYWALRDYGVDGQLGLEPTFQEYINKLCNIFDEVKRVLKKDGTCWVNMGDTYSGNKDGKTDKKVSEYLKETTVNLHKKKGSILEKSLCQIPSRFAIEMSNRGWILRNEIIWHKPNCMPSSVRDRFTVDFEKVFFFVRSKRYWFEQQYDPYIEPMNRWGGEKLKKKREFCDKCNGKGHWYDYGHSGETFYYHECDKCSSSGFIFVESGWDNGTGQNTYRERNMRPNEQGRNKRTVWKITTKPFKEAHFATYPEKLIEPMIKAGCPEGGIILDPFMGSGTTAVVALKHSRKYFGIELNPEYIKICNKRLAQEVLF